MPAGKRAPLGETVNVPPFATPLGSVIAKSKELVSPVKKIGGATSHAADPDGPGEGLGEGEDPGAGLGLGEPFVPENLIASSKPLHAVRTVAHPKRQNFNALRRLIAKPRPFTITAFGARATQREFQR